MCCAGCEAVAQAIVSNGLERYYQHRSALPTSAQEIVPVALQTLAAYDHPEFQKTFVRPTAENESEAALILEGITCAACVWLNEQHLAKQPGVLAVEINYVTRRAKVRWDTRTTRLSQILGAIAAIGYTAHPFDDAKSEQLAQKERRKMLWRVFVAGFGMMQVMMYAIPVYMSRHGDMTHEAEQIMRWASLVLTVPVVFYAAAPFFGNAWRDIRFGRLGMDVPVAIGVGAAFLASCWATLKGSGEVYFDSASMFVFFLLGGRYLEMLARQRALRGVEEIGKILPSVAERILSDGSSEEVPTTTLAVGDTIRIKPGQIVPTDGEVVSGNSHLDESLLTGESRPIPKVAGAFLTGGTLNIDSPLILRVTHVGDATRLATIRRLMERASAEKPRIVTLADLFARRFIVALLILAVVTAAVWWWIDPHRMLWVFVSVLVVSCPCALSLATPVALTVGTERLARMGVLITRGHAIETLAQANVFAFDKTGTLTQGRMSLVHLIALPPGTPSQVLALASGMEIGSEHAIARGLLEAAQQAGISPAQAYEHQAYTGQGVCAQIAGISHFLGRPEFVATQLARPIPETFQALQAEGGTVIALGNARDGWIGLIRLDDALRPEAPALLAQLMPRAQCCILSGDNPVAVAALAQTLHIPEAHGGLTPAQKREHLIALQADANHIVAMVGDGVNDAPVLAQAHVSIAMGGAADLARNQADIVLLRNDLSALGEGITFTQRISRIVKQNLAWSFAYNVTAIPLAMAGWVTPWMAGIGMSASSLLVVLNALRLQMKAPKS